jgi:5-methylcytosine-specific restriction endonuclease McrBC regulatory subunit McrC
MLAVKQITEVTQETYSFHAREKIIHKNLKPENHPYYSDYKPLQKLCVMILNHSKMQYSQSNSPVYGILFDGAWLWEEYLATILCDTKLGNKKFEHPENKTGKGGIHLFKNRRVLRYPDFYRKNDSIVLDAKYKALSSISKNDDDPFLEIKINFNRDDIHQLVTYMYILKAEKGCFIFPDKYRNEYSDDTIRTLSTWLELEGYGKKINGFGLVIPSVNDYKLFKDKMLEIENKLLENI